MNFTVRKISHPILNGVEIYLVSLQSQEVIDEFLKKSPWFNKEDATLGQRFVVEYCEEKNYYEIFEIQLYQRRLKEMLDVYSQINNELVNFFQQN